MKKYLFMFAFVALAGCGGEGSGSAPAASGTGAATQKPADTAAATATATATAAPAAGAYKGVQEGRSVVAYIKDPNDEAQCGVVAAKPEEKLSEDDLKKIAAMVKGELTSTCPTANIVGACRAFGISVQYYGPKYTADSAKKDCKGTWVD